MTKLGVNIDHVATLRQARYRGQAEGEPDPVGAALICEAAGAHGITAHLREDRRHILDRDVAALRKHISTRFNLEMANTPEIVAIALELKPDIVCLVPERREELTTEGGLDVTGSLEAITDTCARMRADGIEVSLFIDPVPGQIAAATRAGCSHVELHTGTFAEAYGDPERRAAELNRLAEGASMARDSGLTVNAGHGLNYENVTCLLARIPDLHELNIGHSIVSRAITTGLSQAVREMLALITLK